MAVLLVSYDLKVPGRNYQTLSDRLKQFPWAKPLESVWLIETNLSAAELRNDLLGYVDTTDRLLVSAAPGPMAWSDTLPQDVKDWIWARLGKG